MRLLESVSGRSFEERVIDRVNLHTKEMKTGDIIITRRFTGHTTEMMLLSGGLASHAAMILKDTNSTAVYVIDCFHDDQGVKKTLINEWLQTAEDGAFEVAYLPLNADLTIDEAKLWRWFNSVESNLYDYALELFAAVDDASSGIPPPFNAEVVPVMLRLNDKWNYGDALLTRKLHEGLNTRYRYLSPLSDIDQLQGP